MTLQSINMNDLRDAVYALKMICSDDFLTRNMGGSRSDDFNYWHNVYSYLTCAHSSVFYMPKTQRLHLYREYDSASIGRWCMVSVDLNKLKGLDVPHGNMIVMSKDYHYKLKTPSQCKDYKEGVTSILLIGGGSNFDYCRPAGAHWDASLSNEFLRQYSCLPAHAF